MNKLAVALMCTSILTGCDTVQVSYKDPDTAAVLADAQDGYSYVELPRTYILVAPASGVVNSGSKDTNAGDLSRQISVAAHGSGGSVKNKPRGQRSAGTQSGGSGGPRQSQLSPSKPNSAKSDSSDGASAQLGYDLANVKINNISWTAKGVPVPDTDFGIMVKGNSGFWRNTTIGVSRYDNSEMPKTISSKAENLVPKRIGEFAGAFAAVASIATTLGVEGQPGSTSSQPAVSTLNPFSVPVREDQLTGDVDGSPGWKWEIKFDSTKVPDSISYADFKNAMPASQSDGVDYWPVPACRPATLTLSFGDSQKPSYVFHLTVGTPEHLRLVTLPIDGSVDLGTVCSGSSKGTINADATEDVTNDLKALQNAVEQVKPKAKGNTAGGGPAGR